MFLLNFFALKASLPSPRKASGGPFRAQNGVQNCMLLFDHFLIPTWNDCGPKITSKSDPKLELSWLILTSKNVSRHAWTTSSFQTSFLNENLSPRTLPGPLKILISLGRGVNFHCFAPFLLGWFLGANLASFWDHFGSQVGPLWAPSWLTTALEHNTKNEVIKKRIVA